MPVESFQDIPNPFLTEENVSTYLVNAARKRRALGLLGGAVMGLALLVSPHLANAAPDLSPPEQATTPSCAKGTIIVYDDLHAATEAINACAGEGLNTLSVVQLVGGKVGVIFYVLDHNNPITPTPPPTALPKILPIPTQEPKFVQPLQRVPYPDGLTPDYFEGQPHIKLGPDCGLFTYAAVKLAKALNQPIVVPSGCIGGY
jgi:hypothetical protein